MKKSMKKFLVLLTVLVMCLAPVLGSPITANATESTAVTYYVKYVATLDELRFQKGTWQDGQEHWALSSIPLQIKDGDILVIEDTANLGVKFSLDVRLSNVTVVSGNSVVVSAKSIDNFFAINGSVSSVTGDVTNAYVYDKSVANFNNNVGTLNIITEKEDLLYATVAVAGTCDRVIASGKTTKHFELYNFKENTLRVTDGSLKTAEGNYSKTPSSVSGITSNTSSDYDDVPKTGDAFFNPLWLIALAAVCFAGSVGIRKMK